MRKNMYKNKRPRQGAVEFVFTHKPLILTLCLVFSLVMTLGSTLSWFTAADTVVNTIRRSDETKEFIIFEVDDFEKEPDEDGQYHKSVGAQNAGTMPGFVRLAVLPVFVVPPVNSGDPPQLLPAKLGTHIIIDDWNLWDMSADPDNDAGKDWVAGGDGYFYYLHRLDPGESTYTLTNGEGGGNRNLFNYLRLANNLPSEYENVELRIEVKVEAAGVTNYREGWWGTLNDAVPASPPVEADILAAILAVDGKLQNEMPYTIH